MSETLLVFKDLQHTTYGEAGAPLVKLSRCSLSCQGAKLGVRVKKGLLPDLLGTQSA